MPCYGVPYCWSDSNLSRKTDIVRQQTPEYSVLCFQAPYPLLDIRCNRIRLPVRSSIFRNIVTDDANGHDSLLKRADIRT